MKRFIDELDDEEAAAVIAAMKAVANQGIEHARHVRGDVYEVRAEAARRAFRILFAEETKFILLALSGFSKTTRKTPRRELDLAETRLKEWRERGGRGSRH